VIQVAPSNRRYTAWIGGSTLAQLDGFDAALLWKDEWEEQGDSCLYSSDR
jgi:actin-related protein